MNDDLDISEVCRKQLNIALNDLSLELSLINKEAKELKEQDESRI